MDSLLTDIGIFDNLIMNIGHSAFIFIYIIIFIYSVFRSEVPISSFSSSSSSWIHFGQAKALQESSESLSYSFNQSKPR